VPVPGPERSDRLERARRPSVRRTGERPNLPFATTPPPVVGPPLSPTPLPHPTPGERAAAALPPSSERKTLPMPGPGERSRPTNPNLAMTVIGPVPLTPDDAPLPPPVMPVIPSGPLSASMPAMTPMPPMPMPPITMPPATMPPTSMPPMPMPSPPTLVPPGHTPPVPMSNGQGPGRALAPSGLPTLVVDEPSQAGARPLVTDPKLGWNTSIKLSAANDGSSTRLASDVINYKIHSNTRWVVLAIALVMVVIALVILIIET
jgi:hypothetical protein